MTAREEILAKLKRANAAKPAGSGAYRPLLGNEPGAEFAIKAKAADAVIHEIESALGLPASLQSLFAKGNAVSLHIAPHSSLRNLPWERASKIMLSEAAPASTDLALSAADFAIAESGTLAFFSGAGRPSAWHFLPEIECVLVDRAAIVPTLEDVFVNLADRTLPSTLNLVTGPSRTADIEQTIERGAHGPRELHIFLSAG